MKLAFCLFKYFPFGGLQRDFLRIAQECVQRGHRVDVFTMDWQGPAYDYFSIKTLVTRGWQNHSRCRDFVSRIQPYLPAYDCVIGFNKMPGLNFYYAADSCYQAKIANSKRSWFYQLSPRYQYYLQNEQAVFACDAHTKILLLAQRQQQEFMHYYKTPAERFLLLPPTLSRDRIPPANALTLRKEFRERYQIKADEFLLLMVGSGFKTKGLKRTLLGLAALPDELKYRCHLFIVGQDNPKNFMRLAKRLKINEQVKFLGGRDDVISFFLASDLLLHPAYYENTGTVILEAMLAGLPVLTTDVCGYADFVRIAGAGAVLSSPYRQNHFNNTLLAMLLSSNRDTWRQNALAWTQQQDLFNMPAQAVDFIEKGNEY